MFAELSFSFYNLNIVFQLSAGWVQRPKINVWDDAGMHSCERHIYFICIAACVYHVWMEYLAWTWPELIWCTF